MLEKYAEKRDFEKSPEPSGVGAEDRIGPLTFVVQKHDARNLHYDFRLECDGVLLSWAVPKGPSLNPADKRLAVMVEDHPLDYATFEGQIPKGEYGAGEVIVWDEGTYSPDDKGVFSWDDRAEAQRRVKEDLAKGKLSVYLRGHKLKGSYALVKTKRGENEWLFFKHKDEFVSEKDLLEQDRSVRSGLTIEDIRAGKLPEESPNDPFVEAEPAKGARRTGLPQKFAPMLATIAPEPFDDPMWLFELKFDGVRIITVIQHGWVKMYSRGDREVAAKFPGLRDQLMLRTTDTLVLDGEVVAFDEKGRSNFEKIMTRYHLQREMDLRAADRSNPVCYCVFDLLYRNGWDLRGVPLHERQRLLDELKLSEGWVRVVEPIPEDGTAFFKAATDMGLEGIIAKQRDSKYEYGIRSPQWLKIKGFHSEEFVVGGYTPGEGSRASTFGALALGQLNEDGKLVYVGNVGSGFDDQKLVELLSELEALQTDESPFEVGPDKSIKVFWTRPEMVVEVKYASWTDGMHLRAPVFLRVRPDMRIEGKAVTGPMEEPEPVPTDPVTPEERCATSSVLEQLEEKRQDLILQVEGHKIPLSSLDKVLWPSVEGSEEFTKRDLLRYFAQISPWLLDHLRDRPLTLARYPNGFLGQHFYQKHWEHELPEFVTTTVIYSGHREQAGEYMICNNLPTLLWLGQIADIELHSWYSRVSQEPDAHHHGTDFGSSEEALEKSVLDYPDFLVIDLDPYMYSGKENPGAEPELDRDAYKKTCEIAIMVKETLDLLGLVTFLKTSGKTGLHIYVPIVREFAYDDVRKMAEQIGLHILKQRPKEVTMDWSVPKRKGKIFYDHNQNSRGKTLATVYSPRAAAGGPVSTPLDWSEILDVYPTDFTMRTVPLRVGAIGDLWASILESKHDLTTLGT